MLLTFGCGSNGDFFTLFVVTGVTTRGKDNSGSIGLLDTNVDSIQSTFSTRQHDLGQVRVITEQWQNDFSLGITKSNIVFKNLGASSSQHDTSKEHTNEWVTITSHPINSRLQNGTLDLINEVLGTNGSRSVTSHTASIGAKITIQSTLMVLSRWERNDSVAIRKCKKREFFAFEIFLNNYFVTSTTEFLVNHNGLETFQSFFGGFGDQYSLSSS
jgi:hypothetical protein